MILLCTLNRYIYALNDPINFVGQGGDVGQVSTQTKGLCDRRSILLGFAYIASVAASLLVALTVTPALCYFLLGESRLVRTSTDSKVVEWPKHRYTAILQWTVPTA